MLGHGPESPLFGSFPKYGAWAGVLVRCGADAPREGGLGGLAPGLG